MEMIKLTMLLNHCRIRWRKKSKSILYITNASKVSQVTEGHRNRVSVRLFTIPSIRQIKLGLARKQALVEQQASKTMIINRQ